MDSVLLLPVLALFAGNPTDVRGQYVEARTCDVYTGACFANADTGLTGKNAVLAWKVESGTVGGTKLDGLGVVAVVAARDTLGQKQDAPAKAVLIVDEKANAAQRTALVDFVKAQTGGLIQDVVAVHAAEVDVNICPCQGNSCATVQAGKAKLTTRCLDTHTDKACGNETEFFPPLAKGVSAKAAMTSEHVYTGKEFNATWSDSDRRGAYVGSFRTR